MGKAVVVSERPFLVERVRAALTGQPSRREVRMFGGLSFMVNEKMVVATFKSGDLLVRVDPEHGRQRLTMPGASVAEMGAGRSMGTGWIRVAAEAIVTDEQLSFWMGEAMAYNAQMG